MRPFCRPFILWRRRRGLIRPGLHTRLGPGSITIPGAQATPAMFSYASGQISLLSDIEHCAIRLSFPLQEMPLRMDGKGSSSSSFRCNTFSAKPIPSCLHTTCASLRAQPSPQTTYRCSLIRNSTRPCSSAKRTLISSPNSV